MRALIIDDCCVARSCLREMLRQRSIDCEEAVDGQAALDLLHGGGKFDLAFVDWHMPVMNGLEMLKRLRAEHYTALKAIMVTAEGDRRHIVSALAAGADEYLMKPFDAQALSQKLAILGIGEAS